MKKTYYVFIDHTKSLLIVTDQERPELIQLFSTTSSIDSNQATTLGPDTQRSVDALSLNSCNVYCQGYLRGRDGTKVVNELKEFMP